MDDEASLAAEVLEHLGGEVVLVGSVAMLEVFGHIFGRHRAGPRA